MEWRAIPGLEAYEATLTGHVRRRDTRHRISRVGNYYRLHVNGQLHKLSPTDIAALAFPGPEVVELEMALRQAREGTNTATAPVASPERPQPSVAAKPKEKRPAPTYRACTVCLGKFVPEGNEHVCATCRKTGPKRAQKRYCVVCGRLLPPGYWRRCPDHASPEGAGHTEDDFSGSVAL